MPVKIENLEKLTHQYSYEIKTIQEFFDSPVEEILQHIIRSKLRLPDGQPMLQRISLATKALGTPEVRKETANQFITALAKQLFGKAFRQTDVRRSLNRYKFRFAELPIISDYLSPKKKRGLSPGPIDGKKKELKDEKKIGTTETKHPPEESKQKASHRLQPDSTKTLSPKDIQAADKMILGMAYSILDQNRPMLTESAIMGADFILGRLQEELSIKRITDTAHQQIKRQAESGL